MRKQGVIKRSFAYMHHCIAVEIKLCLLDAYCLRMPMRIYLGSVWATQESHVMEIWVLHVGPMCARASSEHAWNECKAFLMILFLAADE